MFCDFIVASKADEKVIVHCSAGIGRTGTIITLMYVILLIQAQLNSGIKDPKFSIFSVVRRIREQRMGMVQMPEQYSFIYQFFYKWLADKKLF